MIHGANSSEIVKNEYFHAAINQLKSEGRLRFCGVSSHGENWKGKPKESMEKVLMTAVDDGRFDVLLLVYNFFQHDMGNRILNACKEKNIGTAIMKVNPVFDYSQLETWITELEQKNEEISSFERWALDGFKVSAAKADSLIKEQNLNSADELYRDIAIPFVLSNPNVNTALMNFTNFDNLKYHLKFSGKTLTKSEEKRLISYKETFGQFHCRHACGLCEDKCPNEIHVNTIMRYNYYFTVKGQEKYAMQEYQELPGGKPDVCLNCEGFCEKACPYGVLTRPLLAFAHKNLSFDSTHYT
jgi:predicted aldo/keto reductase-like oxidoreductase